MKLTKCLIAFISLSPFSIFAQTATEGALPDIFSLSLESLSQVKITGSTLTPQSINITPSSVTVFNHEQIKRFGFQTLDQLINVVPGYQSYRSSASSLNFPFSSRGRSIGGIASEILVLVDGHRIAESLTGGSAPIISKYPLQNIERIEFIRGTGSAIYGSNAMMGVINIITRSEVKELNVTSGSFDKRQIAIQHTIQQNDFNVNLFAQISKDTGDTFNVIDSFTATSTETDDPRLLSALNLKLNWNQSKIQFQRYYNKSQNFFEQGQISNGFNKHENILNSISFSQDFNFENLNASFWLSYSQADARTKAQITGVGDLASISSPSSNSPAFIDFSAIKQVEVRAQWRNNWLINDISSLQFGLELRNINIPESRLKNNYDVYQLSQGITPITYYEDLLPTTILLEKRHRNIVGIYLQHQQEISDSLHLTFGLRFHDFSKTSSELIPKFSLVKTYGEHHSIKLLYGKAFRAPTLFELYLENNPVSIGNPNLTPETVQTGELIWIGQWTNTNFSLGYFNNSFNNSINRMTKQQGVLQYNNQSQHDHSSGFELELSKELGEHLLISIGHTYITENLDSTYREANKFSSIMLNYELGNWNTNVNLIHHGQREMSINNNDLDRIPLDKYWQVFTKVSYDIATQWQAYFQVENLLDEKIYSPAGAATAIEGVINRGRTVLAGVTWSY